MPTTPDWARLSGGFRGRGLQAGHSIPPGEVRTYGGVARAVGTSLARDPLPTAIPWHRVVRVDHVVVAYSMGGPVVTARMRHREGVDIHRGRVRASTR